MEAVRTMEAVVELEVELEGLLERVIMSLIGWVGEPCWLYIYAFQEGERGRAGMKLSDSPSNQKTNTPMHIHTSLTS